MTQAQKDQAAKAKADAEAQSNNLDLLAINTIGNHSPGDRFTAKDQVSYDRFISLGVAKKA